MTKYTGKNSAAYLIRKFLGVAWYLGILFGFLIIGWHLYLLIVRPDWFGESIKLQIETPGLVFRFAEGYTHPSAEKLYLFQFSLVLPILAIGLFVIYHLRKIFATLFERTPFTFENGQRIRAIGFAIIAVTILRVVLTTLLGFYFSNLINLPGLQLYANIRLQDFGGILTGLIALVLAEVFRHGAQLQEEQDLTV